MSDKSNLKEISVHRFLLKKNHESKEITLKDKAGEGDMFFIFCLKYAQRDQAGSTYVEIVDKFHAKITIEAKPQAMTKPSAPILLGTYANTNNLYMDFTVLPRGAEGLHYVVVSFLYK